MTPRDMHAYKVSCQDNGDMLSTYAHNKSFEVVYCTAIGQHDQQHR